MAVLDSSMGWDSNYVGSILKGGDPKSWLTSTFGMSTFFRRGNMKVIMCVVLLSLSACSFFGGNEKLEEACARRHQIKGDADRTFAALDGACLALEE